MKKHFDLTTGSVMRHIWRMTPPMIVAFLAMMIFNLSDTWFVSKLGTIPLAAMGFTFPIMMIVHSVGMGIALGVSSCVSRAIGQGNHEAVKHLCTYAILLTILVMSVISLLAYLTLPHLLSALGAEGEARELAKDYLFIVFAFIPVTVICYEPN